MGSGEQGHFGHTGRLSPLKQMVCTLAAFGLIGFTVAGCALDYEYALGLCGYPGDPVCKKAAQICAEDAVACGAALDQAMCVIQQRRTGEPCDPANPGAVGGGAEKAGDRAY